MKTKYSKYIYLIALFLVVGASTTTAQQKNQAGANSQEQVNLVEADDLVYMREEAGGLVIGGYEYNPRARWLDGVPWSHGGRTLPADFDLFDPLMDGAIRRIPFLEQAEV